MSVLTQWIDSSPERQRIFAQERLIAETAESIWAAMEAGGATKTVLAENLGKSKPFVTQVLNGSRNMTLRTLADIARCLGMRARFVIEPEAHFISALATKESWINAELLSDARLVRLGKPLNTEVDIANDGHWRTVGQGVAA